MKIKKVENLGLPLITFSCWQSLIRESPEYMDQFNTIIVDEAHLAQAKSITTIMESSTAENRFGFTATLQGSETHEMILTGLFGPVERLVTTRELMNRGILAEARIQMVTLSHPKHARKLTKKFKYQDEIQFLIDCDARNEFLANLALAVKGNTLVLYTRVEQHGERIYRKILEQNTNRPVHFVHGGVDGSVRNDIRHIVETSENAIVVASYGTFATGIDIARLHNLILASPHKSRILVPQAIGRGLRIGSDKTECQIYDIVDDLSSGKRTNYVLGHAEERLKIYYEQEMNVRLFQTELPYDPVKQINKSIGETGCLILQDR